METCMLLCFHVHVHIYMYVSMYLVLTFDPTGKGSIGTKRNDHNKEVTALDSDHYRQFSL